MEPRIATLLDQSPCKRLTLDPSVLTTHSTVAPRYIEGASNVSSGCVDADLPGHFEYVDTRHKTSTPAHSSAPLARVLNDPASSSPPFQPPASRQTSQHATFRTRSNGSVSGVGAIPSDAQRRGEQCNSVVYSGGDVSLIQLPKPPQVPRRPAKRPRIPPLLQGLHQPPPLPPKNKLFPPISERSALGSDVADRFSLASAFPISIEDLAEARAPPDQRNERASDDVGWTTTDPAVLVSPRVQEPSSEKTTDSSPAPLTTDGAQTTVKTARKRTKWSQKETEDLLIGVSRFGIGRWKQILECTDFSFSGRTAVDLKDRFRICRPGEGLKARKTAILEDRVASRSTDGGATISEATCPPAANAPARSASTEDVHTNDRAASKSVEVYGPFMKSRRRARREFNDADDKNLLKGFKRHGAVWHAMRDDFELGFGMRHATDLRDRFRIRYPDQFARAGYKLKPKEARALEEAEELRAHKAEESKPSAPTATKLLKEGGELATPTASVPAPAPARASTTSKPPLARPTFDLVTDFSFDDDDGDDEGDRSPIVLNRNILQWADENSTWLPPSTATSAAQASIQTATPAVNDVLYNPLAFAAPSDVLYNPLAFAATSDGLHINPLATLKLPSTAQWNSTGTCSTWSFAPPSATMAPPPSLPRPAALKPGDKTASCSRGQAELRQRGMRTPNLPNIVFPYVPQASARNAVHNLPAPADILCERQAGNLT